jgi:hypothetical protein
MCIDAAKKAEYLQAITIGRIQSNDSWEAMAPMISTGC